MDNFDDCMFRFMLPEAAIRGNRKLNVSSMKLNFHEALIIQRLNPLVDVCDILTDVANKLSPTEIAIMPLGPLIAIKAILHFGILTSLDRDDPNFTVQFLVRRRFENAKRVWSGTGVNNPAGVDFETYTVEEFWNLLMSNLPSRIQLKKETRKEALEILAKANKASEATGDNSKVMQAIPREYFEEIPAKKPNFKL